MGRPTRADETQNFTVIHGGRSGDDPEEKLSDIEKMIHRGLEARASLVAELSEGVEYEAQLVRERLGHDGVDADLSAIRIGEFFCRLSEFRVLQRLHRAVKSRINGAPMGVLDIDASDDL